MDCPSDPPTQEAANQAAPPADDERRFVAALRRGDEAAFVDLVQRYRNSMLRVARLYVADTAAAEDVVQETFLAALRGLHRFEGRSSLKTWLYSILVKRAITRAKKEDRYIPFTDLESEMRADGPVVDPERFLPADHPQDPDHWQSPPEPWEISPEDWLLKREILARIELAIEGLSANQRAVITLCDIQGWSPGEVCNIFGLSETNQRVLLHRARARVRNELERYLKSGS